MGVIWTPKTRTKQPTNPVGIDYSNPATRGITDAWVGSNPGLTTKNKTTSIQTAGSFKPGPGGATFLSVASGSKNGLRIASDFNTLFPSASQGTIVLCLRHTDTTLRAGITLGSEDNSDHGKRILLAAPFSDGNLYWDWGSFSTGGRLVISGYTKTTAVTTLVATAGPSAGRAVWRDGVLIGSAASSNSVVAFTKSFSLGSADISGTSESDATEFYMFAAYGRELSSAEAQVVSRNPWQLFAPEKRPLFFSTGGGANTTGTLAVTLDAATLTGVGAVTRSGTLATTLDAATLTGVGNVTRSGTLAVTLDAATLAGTGAVTTSGTLAVTLDDVTLAGVGSVAVGTNRDGTLAVTLDAATLAGVGAVTRSGTLAVTLDAATLAGVGTAGQAVTGTLSTTLDNVRLTGVGAIPAAPSTGGGKTTGKNLSRKQKKKLKAVESQEWLKAEETARQLLSDRFTKQTPQEKAQALETYIESLQPVIEALKALTSQIEEVVEEAPVIELTPHQEVIQRFDRLEKKVKSVEELIIILMADL